MNASGTTAPSQYKGGLLHKLVAEAVGTYALVFVGCGSIMVDTITQGSLGHLGVSLAFGLVIAVMVYATGHISGAHLNPAVTVGFASIGRFSWREVPAYIGAQVAAATAAAFSLLALLGPIANIGATAPSISMGAASVFEFLLTFFLMYVITAVATDSRAEGAMAGLAIGGTVAMAALFAGPLTGASMNPARSLGPALANGSLSAIHIYLAAPLAGACLGARAYAWTQRCGPADPNNATGCC